jgi:hypothetical protein
MLNKTSTFFLIVILFLGIFLLKVKRTSADLTAQRTVYSNRLRATTLALDKTHTASFTSITNLFNTTGYQPGGFDIKAVKLKKAGELDFKYQFKTVITDKDSPLCYKLTLKVLKNWHEVYNGLLANFSTEAVIASLDNDDWIFVLSFLEDEKDLKNSSCRFDFVARTWRKKPDEQLVGFWSKKQLSNLVATGTW